MPGRIKSIGELREELEKEGYMVVGLVGAKRLNGYVNPRMVKLAWGLHGIWDIVIDLNVAIKVPGKVKVLDD